MAQPAEQPDGPCVGIWPLWGPPTSSEVAVATWPGLVGQWAGYLEQRQFFTERISKWDLVLLFLSIILGREDRVKELYLKKIQTFFFLPEGEGISPREAIAIMCSQP